MVLTVIAVHDEIFLAFNFTNYFNHGRISKCFSKSPTGFKPNNYFWGSKLTFRGNLLSELCLLSVHGVSNNSVSDLFCNISYKVTIYG